LDVRIEAQEANRLKNDTAFKQFVESVRENQILTFRSSAACDVEQREDAHAIMRALDQIEAILEAAIAAETLRNRKQR
jgi:hypothetical protein